MPRLPFSQWGKIFNFAGGGLAHMELFPEGETLVCCEILVGDNETLIWAGGDLIYCIFET